MDGVTILTLIIEAIGATVGFLGSYRVHAKNGDVVTALLMATFAICCILLGSITGGAVV